MVTICLILASIAGKAQQFEPNVPFKDVQGKVISEQEFRKMLSSGSYRFQSLMNDDAKILEYQLTGGPTPVPPADDKHSHDSGYLGIAFDAGVPFKDEKGGVITEQQFRDALATGRYTFFSLRNEENKAIEYQLEGGTAVKLDTPSGKVATTSTVTGVTYRDENNKEVTEADFRSRVAAGANYVAIKNEMDQVVAYQLMARDAAPVSGTTTQPAPARETIKVGHYLPEITLKDIYGNVLLPADWKGKVVLLSFWFSSCKPCIDELPEMNEVAQIYRANPNVLLLAVTSDTEEKAKAFLEAHPMNMRVCANAREVIDQCYVLYYPTNIIVDKNGVVRNVFTGSLGNPKETLTYNIDAALK